MKGFLIAVVLLVILGVGGYFSFTYFLKNKSAEPSRYKSASVKLMGVLKVGKGDDYEYTLTSEGKVVGVNSYTVQLKDFVDQKIEVEGQYSGTTLFADTVTPVIQ